MTVEYLKLLKITKLRKELKRVITWDNLNGVNRDLIIKRIEEYEKKSSPKYCLFIQNLNNNEAQF
jgi:hypothetical protein